MRPTVSSLILRPGLMALKTPRATSTSSWSTSGWRGWASSLVASQGRGTDASISRRMASSPGPGPARRPGVARHDPRRDPESLRQTREVGGVAHRPTRVGRRDARVEGVVERAESRDVLRRAGGGLRVAARETRVVDRPAQLQHPLAIRAAAVGRPAPHGGGHVVPLAVAAHRHGDAVAAAGNDGPQLTRQRLNVPGAHRDGVPRRGPGVEEAPRREHDPGAHQWDPPPPSVVDMSPSPSRSRDDTGPPRVAWRERAAALVNGPPHHAGPRLTFHTRWCAIGWTLPRRHRRVVRASRRAWSVSVRRHGG